MNLSRYIFKRLLYSLPLLLFLPFVTFLLIHLAPGDFFDSIRMNPQISPETVERYEKMYHLDEPVLFQYVHWLKSIAQLDFGYSFAYKQPVLRLLLSRLGNTLLLTVSAFLLAWILALLFGLWAGMRQAKLPDFMLSSAAYAGLSIPSFFLCILFLWFAAASGILPLGGATSIYYDGLSAGEKLLDRLRHMVIPVSVLAFASFAYLFRLMRAQTLEVKDADFIFYLRTRRISERSVVFKHIGRNAINPMISLFGLELPSLFSGAALVEIFTGWPGLGSMMLAAVRSQDLFLVMGNILVIAALLVLGNLIADILMVAADPRIRLSEESRT